MGLEAITRDLEALDALAEEVGKVRTVPSSHAPAYEPPPVVETRPEPSPEPVRAPVAEEKVQDAPPAPAPVAEAAPSERPPIMPIPGKILEDVSSALDLILTGMHTRIVRANLQEQADQLGPLSMIMASVKKAKDQADHLLGRAQT